MSAAPSTAVGGRRERRKREVHDRILAAAIPLFERQGFAATTALEISEAADVAEKTFYNHFPTKQHLIQELAEASLAEVRARLREAREAPGSIADRLEHFFRRAADDADQASRELTRELILEMVRVSQVEGFGPERGRDLHACFGALLTDAITRGELPPTLDVPFHAELAVATYTGILISWVSQPRYPLRERLLATARVLARCLETETCR